MSKFRNIIKKQICEFRTTHLHSLGLNSQADKFSNPKGKPPKSNFDTLLPNVLLAQSKTSCVFDSKHSGPPADMKTAKI